MKKKIVCLLIFINTLLNAFSQNIEKIGNNETIKYISYEAAQGSYPTGMYVDEVTYEMTCYNPAEETYSNINLNNFNKNVVKDYSGNIPYLPSIRKIGNDFWGTGSSGISYIINGAYYKYIENVQSGISFILKKGSGYIVYYVDKNGIPGAVDTEGKIYTNKEAVEYLKQYDSDKYEESLLRAEELGLKELFGKAEVLVWGETYYSTNEKYNEHYGKYLYKFPELIQYDNNGLGYQFHQSFGAEHYLCCYKGKDCLFWVDDVTNQSSVISEILEKQYGHFTSSWYVGFGGNIYYYIAGEEYTEVFRIRRTWGDPDFYAMAINGYTDDEYGKYVDEVLPKLNKADLRLLRNTVFALYGVHFKNEDLSKHFDKEVWYTDEGKTAGEIELPKHRQKLVEMILEIEK